MNAEVRKFHSPDIDNLEEYQPINSDNFGFLLQIMVGPKGKDGSESFEIEVCTPDWLKSHYPENEVILGLHRLIVFRYDFMQLKSWINKYISKCDGKNWQEIAQKIQYLGEWEFNDYKE